MPILRPKEKDKAVWYLGFALLGLLLGPVIFPFGNLLLSLLFGLGTGFIPYLLMESSIFINNTDERRRMKDELLQDEYDRMEARKRRDREGK